MAVIQAVGRLEQEDWHEFKSSLGYRMRLSQKPKEREQECGEEDRQTDEMECGQEDRQTGVVMYACNPKTQDTEAGLRIQV